MDCGDGIAHFLNEESGFFIRLLVALAGRDALDIQAEVVSRPAVGLAVATVIVTVIVGDSGQEFDQSAAQSKRLVTNWSDQDTVAEWHGWQFVWACGE